MATTTVPTCTIQAALFDDQFISKPEFSTPIIGSISDLNPGGKGIDFVITGQSNTVNIILPLQQNVTIERLVKVQILQPSNVNRFRLTFLNQQKENIGQVKPVSTDSKQTTVSPKITTFPIQANLLKKLRSLKIEILDTNDKRPPTRVTILFQACFKQTKPPSNTNE